MQHRTKTLDQFSTFLVLTNYNTVASRWQIDNKLKRNMERILAEREVIPDLLACKFLHLTKVQKNRLSSLHLTAYLQEVAYFTSLKVFRRFNGIITEFTWADYWGLAIARIAEPDLLLCKYDEKLGVKITTYAQNKLQSKIANDAYASLGWQLSSDWGLLRKMSATRRKKVLQEMAGLSNKQLDEYLCVWECFNVIYTPQQKQNSRRLPTPTEEQFKKMNTQYNLMNNTQVTVEIFREMLSTCIEVARRFYNSKTVSYPENFDPIDDNYYRIEDIEKEDNQRKELNQLKLILEEAFGLLTEEEKLLLQLWKGLKITQQDIIKIFAINYPNFVSQQYQISRKIERVRKKMLEYVIKNFLNNKSKINQEMLESLKIPFYDWLENYYKDKITRCFKDLLEQEDLSENINSKQLKDVQQFLLPKFRELLINNLQLKDINSDCLNESLSSLICELLERKNLGY